MKNPEEAWPEGMPPAAAYCGEDDRARVFASYGLDALDDDPELGQIAQFAAKLCDSPIALVSIVEKERQRFLARDGIDARETPRSVSFCAHAMLLGNAMIVPDAREDARFADNPLVTGPPHIRFYAGQPLVSEEGAPLGALCIIDSEPRPGGLTPLQQQGLEVLAKAVMRRLRGHRQGREAEKKQAESEERLRALADSIPAIAWSAGPEGRPNFFNRRWYEFTGLTDGSLAHSGEAVVHPEDYSPMRERWEGSVARAETFEHESRVRRADGEYRWMLHRAEPVRGNGDEIVQWFGTITDIDTTHKLSEARDLLAKELSHRIKNIFAVIAGLVSLSARSQPEHKEFANGLTDTIRALGRAHDFIRTTEGTSRESLQGLLAELFAPYGLGDATRVRVSGDDCKVCNRAATPLALVFHELATNSAKYGALAKADGHIALEIEDKGETLVLHWTEHGGDPPKGQADPGFGSRLVEMSISGQLGGSWQRRFEPTGMVAELVFAKSAVCDG